MNSRKSVSSILHSPTPLGPRMASEGLRPGPLGLSSGIYCLSHWLFKYIGIMLVCGRSLRAPLRGSGLLGAACVDPLDDQRSRAALPRALSTGPMRYASPGPREAYLPHNTP